MQPSQSLRRLHAGLLLAGLAIGAVVLYLFPPDRYAFYPVCPIHQYTGLLCPGCGATRAFAALLHGHVAEALRLNALVLVVFPGLLIYGLCLYRRHGKWLAVPSFVSGALLLVAAIFTIARNVG